MSIDVWADAPEGATHYDPVDQNFLREVGPALLMYRNNVGWVVPHHCQYATTVEETERPLMIRPVWNGEGLPPVGADALLKKEYKLTEGTRLESFPAGTVVYVGGHANFGGCDLAVIIIKGRHFCGTIIPELLERVRTPEQIVEDERKKAIAEMVDSLGCDPEAIKTAEFIRCGILYDAGYRKQVAP